MLLPPWLWRVLRSRGFKRFLIWFPISMVLAAVLGYVGVNLHGKKVWEDTVKEMNQRGFPSTMKEALGEPPEGVVDVSEVQVVLDEIERIEMGDDPLGDISSMELPGLVREVFLDYEGGGAAGPDTTVFFADPISINEAGEKLLEVLEPYEARRKALLLIKPDWWVVGRQDENSVDCVAFLNRAWAFLMDHAIVSIAAGRSDLFVEDVNILSSWCIAINQTPQTAMGYVIGGSVQSMLFEVLGLGLMSGEFESGELDEFKVILAKLDAHNGLRVAHGIEVSGWIEGYDELLGVRPQVNWTSWLAGWSMDRETLERKGMSLVYAFGPRGMHAASLAKTLELFAGAAAEERPIMLKDLKFYRDRASARPDFPDLEVDYYSPPYSECAWEYLAIVANRSLKDSAEKRMCRIAIDLELQRMTHEEFPIVINGPNFAQADPFGDGELNYRREKDGGYSLWSVGPDEVDDGGTGDDIVFRYWNRRGEEK